MAEEIIIEPELLKSLYWGLDLSTFKIAEIFRCYDSTIGRKLRSNRIPVRTISERTRVQQQFLMDENPEAYSKSQSKRASTHKFEKHFTKRMSHITVVCSCGCHRKKQIKQSDYNRNKNGHFFYSFDCYNKFRKDKNNWKGTFPGTMK